MSSRLRFLPGACTGPRTPLQRALVGATGVNKEVGIIGGWRDLLAAASRLGKWSAPWLSNHTFSRGGQPEGWSRGSMAAWGSQADTSHSSYSSDEAKKYGWWKEKGAALPTLIKLPTLRTMKQIHSDRYWKQLWGCYDYFCRVELVLPRGLLMQSVYVWPFPWMT